MLPRGRSDEVIEAAQAAELRLNEQVVVIDPTAEVTNDVLAPIDLKMITIQSNTNNIMNHYHKASRQ